MVSCAPTYYAKYQKKGKKLVVAKTEFEYVSGDEQKKREVVLVQAEGHKFPICLKKNKDSYTALLMMCTHRSCELNIGGHVYSCPCQGSEFDLEGNVLNGPAEDALKTFKTETDENNVYIFA